MIETATPFPEATGFSVSTFLAAFTLTLLVATTPVGLSNDGLTIAGSSTPLQALKRDLLEYNDVGSAEAAWKEARGAAVSGLEDLEDDALAAEDEAVEEFEVNEEKTEPNTRFALSREASFLSSRRNLDGFLGSGGGGWGLRSKGMKPAGSRVMCIECGRRCLGRQGGSGSLTCDLSVAKWEGT
jgi:hypothetical protein